MPAPLAPVSDTPAAGTGTPGIEERMLRHVESDGAPPEEAKKEAPAASDKAPAPDQPAEEVVEEKAEEAPAEEQPVESEGTVSIPRAEYDDLKAGTLRHADYTQKTQAIATERQALETARAELRATLDKEAQTLEAAQQWLQTQLPDQEPDWQKLATEVSDAEYTRRYATWAQQKEKLAAVQGKLAKIADAKRADQQAEFQKYLKVQEQKLVERIPDWKDATKAKTEMDGISTFVKQTFPETTDTELAQIVDHRWWALARDAMLYRQALAAKPKITRQTATPAMAKPGAKTNEPLPKADPLRGKLDRLAQTGQTRDAEAAFLDLVGRGAL